MKKKTTSIFFFFIFFLTEAVAVRNFYTWNPKIIYKHNQNLTDKATHVLIVSVKKIA